MESPSGNSFSSTKKSPSIEKSVRAAESSGKRQQQSHSAAQRQDFLAAVQRLGTVAEAAKELGLNRSTCQKWANAAGIRRKRQYSQADKDQFHAVLNRAGNIVEAAKELGRAHVGRPDQSGTQETTDQPNHQRWPAQRYSPAVIESSSTCCETLAASLWPSGSSV